MDTKKKEKPLKSNVPDQNDDDENEMSVEGSCAMNFPIYIGLAVLEKTNEWEISFFCFLCAWINMCKMWMNEWGSPISVANIASESDIHKQDVCVGIAANIIVPLSGR